jgi:hypothetical protein
MHKKSKSVSINKPLYTSKILEERLLNFNPKSIRNEINKALNFIPGGGDEKTKETIKHLDYQTVFQEMKNFNKDLEQRMEEYQELKEENENFSKKFKQTEKLKEFENRFKAPSGNAQKKIEETFIDLIRLYKEKGYNIPDLSVKNNLFEQSALLLENEKILDFYKFNSKLKDDKDLEFLNKINTLLNEKLTASDEPNEGQKKLKKRRSNFLKLSSDNTNNDGGKISLLEMQRQEDIPLDELIKQSKEIRRYNRSVKNLLKTERESLINPNQTFKKLTSSSSMMNVMGYMKQHPIKKSRNKDVNVPISVNKKENKMNSVTSKEFSTMVNSNMMNEVHLPHQPNQNNKDSHRERNNMKTLARISKVKIINTMNENLDDKTEIMAETKKTRTASNVYRTSSIPKTISIQSRNKSISIEELMSIQTNKTNNIEDGRILSSFQSQTINKTSQTAEKVTKLSPSKVDNITNTPALPKITHTPRVRNHMQEDYQNNENLTKDRNKFIDHIYEHISNHQTDNLREMITVYARRHMGMSSKGISELFSKKLEPLSIMKSIVDVKNKVEVVNVPHDHSLQYLNFGKLETSQIDFTKIK